MAIEVDELDHVDRNLNNEIERQKALEREFNCVFIRISPDEKNSTSSKKEIKYTDTLKNQPKNL